MISSNYLQLGLLSTVLGWLSLGSAASAALLIGNTDGNNIVSFDEISGEFLGEFIGSSDGLDRPDTLLFGPDGNLYISSGTTPANSGIFRFAPDGTFLDIFAAGNGMFRPYGIAFGPDQNLYVSSFLSDQILRYDGITGDFIDVFAAGDGTTPTGLNGPNGLIFGPDNRLYVTTQGSVATNGVPDFTPGFPSLVLSYDITTGAGEVFANQPDPDPESFGFVSFLGMAFGPNDGNLYISDFANSIRRYDFATGTLLDSFSTNYTGTIPSNNFIGSLAFDAEGDLFTVGFDFTNNNVGSILKYDGTTFERSLVVNASPELQRPIGLLFTPEEVPEPAAILGFLVFAGGLYATRRQLTTS